MLPLINTTEECYYNLAVHLIAVKNCDDQSSLSNFWQQIPSFLTDCFPPGFTSGFIISLWLATPTVAAAFLSGSQAQLGHRHLTQGTVVTWPDH